MLKVVVIGYGEMFTNIIAGVLDSKSKIVGVFRHDRVKYSGLKRFFKDTFNPNQDYNYMKSYNLHEIKAKTANSEEFRKQLIKLNPDIMLVASWSEKISKETFNIPKIATINVHPSLLPKYRGPNPYLQTILNGEEQTGVTFHLMTEKFDAGAILDQRTVKIAEYETAKELKSKITLTARGSVCELLEKLSEDVIFPVTQNEEKASYYSIDFDPEIKFTEEAKKISARIRCIHPWAKTYFYLEDYIFVPDPYKITILENTTQMNNSGDIVDINIDDMSLTIVTGDNKLIRLAGLKQYGMFGKFFTKCSLKKLQQMLK